MKACEWCGRESCVVNHNACKQRTEWARAETERRRLQRAIDLVEAAGYVVLPAGQLTLEAS